MLIFFSKWLRIKVGLQVPKVPVHFEQTRVGHIWLPGAPAASVDGNAPTVTLLGPTITILQQLYPASPALMNASQEFQREA